MTLRASPPIGSGCSPEKLLFGREIRTKLPRVKLENKGSFNSKARARYEVYQKRVKIYHDKRERAALHKFKVDDKVFITNKAQSKLYSRFARTPYIIEEKLDKGFI